MYLIPANSKKGQLIFNMFRPIDLLIFSIGASISLILLLAVQSNDLTATIIKLTPIVTCAILVMPVPYYHNFMMLIKDVLNFYSSRRIYLWKGWCARYGFSENEF